MRYCLNMTGSLQIKNNKYYIVLNTYENGKRKIKWIHTDLPAKGNKTKAQKLLREAHSSQTIKRGFFRQKKSPISYEIEDFWSE